MQIFQLLYQIEINKLLAVPYSANKPAIMSFLNLCNLSEKGVINPFAPSLVCLAHYSHGDDTNYYTDVVAANKNMIKINCVQTTHITFGHQTGSFMVTE
jgi:hypothetical protein